MSVLSRYYFVFLLCYFVFSVVKFISTEEKDKAHHEKKQTVLWGPFTATILFVLFSIIILAFDQDFVSVDFDTLIFGGFVLVFVVLGFILTNKVFKEPCPVLTNIVLFLMALGFINLWRLDPNLSDSGLAVRQLGFGFLGFGFTFFIPLFFRIFKEFEKMENIFIALCLILAGLVVAADVIAYFTQIPIIAIDQFGAARWVSIGGITMQTSEFVKPVFVMYLACAFRTKPSVGKLIFCGASSFALIMLMVAQRDLGGALMFFTTFMVLFYVSTGNKILFTTGLFAMAFASVISYQIFAHLRIRVAAWRNPWEDISNQGFQITQSLFAIGTWGPFGIGLGRGLANRIPVVERDVIFSAITEEFGWVFALLLITIYFILLVRGVYIARKSKRPLYALMALGFCVFLAFQAFVAIGGNIKLIPMTGITLPFVSYGGSSVFVSVLMFGVLNWLNGKLKSEVTA